MTDHHFFAIAKLTGASKLKAAAIHNHREFGFVPENIDPSKMHLNYVLEGPNSARGILDLDQALKEAAHVTKGRKDRVQALEIVFSLPPATAIAQEEFFFDCLNWVKKQFPCPVLSAIVHLDEAAPHCHIILLPLVNGKMNGSDLMGNAPKLRARHIDFSEKVGKIYGLKYEGKPEKLSYEQRTATTKIVYERLINDPARLASYDVKALIQKAISLDPMSWAKAVSIRLPAAGTFVGIMTRPVRPI